MADELTNDDVDRALRVLAAVAEDRGALAAVDAERRVQLQKLAGEVARPDLKQRKRLQRELLRRELQDKKARDEALRQQTGIRQLRAQPVFQPALPPSSSSSSSSSSPPSRGRLTEPRKCYVCKREYLALHHFYDQLCLECGDDSFRRRARTVDLRDRVAVVTGARVKIGYQGALLLLRSGCTVVACTRFPHDAAQRYAREPDFDDFRDRLHIYGVDLRHTPSVEQLCHHLAERLPRLDFQIHNACQTVRRPPGFYTHLVDAELAPLPSSLANLVAGDAELRARSSLPRPALLSQADPLALPAPDSSASPALSPSVELFPRGVLDADLQQVDLRAHNSWRLTLGEVPTLELLEVLLVNATAPFVMASRLKPLMLRARAAPPNTSTSSDPTKHIVMVSAMEGQFSREHKTDKHPHTNMAKAALNMLVRTSAQDYVKDGICLNAVDTGWVTDEDPAHLAARKVEEHRFSPPLDIVDGAARIVDPIVDGFATGAHAHGVFFKDYRPTGW